LQNGDKRPISFLLTSPATEFDGRPAVPLPSTRFMAPRWFSNTARGKSPVARKAIALAKEELLTMEGQIDEILPDGRFGVTLDNEHRIIAYTAGKMRKFRIRSVVGDRVHVEMTPYDLSKGRIVFRERTPGVGPSQRRSFKR
jgi:translation initiation factor IF-1